MLSILINCKKNSRLFFCDIHAMLQGGCAIRRLVRYRYPAKVVLLHNALLEGNAIHLKVI